MEWHQDRRRRTLQGGLSCSILEPPSSPPAPREGKQSSQVSAALSDLPDRASRTNSQGKKDRCTDESQEPSCVMTASGRASSRARNKRVGGNAPQAALLSWGAPGQISTYTGNRTKKLTDKDI